MTAPRTPTLEGVINRATRMALRRARVALPARVETYDATKQRVTVQPLILDGYTDENGDRQAERLPVINGVPVVFPGGGGFRVTFPIAVGDVVLLVFSSSSLDRWLALGGEVDPEDDRRHDLNDAIAIPGLHSFAAPLATAPTSTLSIGKDGGGPTIEIGASDIQVGGSSALATKADIDALRTWLTTHTHAGVTTGGGVSGVPSTTAPSATGTLVTKGG